MDKFISSFNESKSITRVDKGMWEDGDEGVKVLIDIKDYPFTLSMLKQVFTDIKKDQEYILQEMVDELNRRDADGVQMYVKYKLDTRHRLEHFFGQCFVEAKTTKGDFTLEEELGKFTENNIISYRGKARLEEAKKLYPQYYDKTDPSKWAKFVGNAMYSDRGKGYLGNDGGDDGFNFRGRGIKQLTGKFNYKDFNKYAHNNYWLDEEVNFVNSPDLLILDGKYALVSAAYFWIIERSNPKKYRLYEIADKSKADSDNSDIVERITAVINPQKLSLEQRKEAYKRIKQQMCLKYFSKEIRMKFKILLLTLITSLNLYAYEPLSPENAINKFNNDFYQLNDYDSSPWRDYGTKSKPSFACYDTKGKYKFKKYSLEDFICQSNYNSFRDNYFADLYNLIVKENPNLKDKAQKIARERIKDSKKECIRYSKKEYDYSFVAKSAFFVSESIYCVKNFYREYTAKLALILYESDKELFSRIYGEDYEKFKEVFEDTLKYVPIEYGNIPRDVKRAENNNEFLQKYKIYHYDDDYPQIDDMLYIMLVQYSLIDKNGHLVLPENRKNDGKN